MGTRIAELDSLCGSPLTFKYQGRHFRLSDFKGAIIDKILV